MLLAGTERAEKPDMDRLIAEYGSSLLRLCCLYLRNRAQAEDAVQDTFIKVYEKYGSFEGRSAEKTWITSIAVNTCRNYLRSPWHRRNMGEEGLYLLEQEPPELPDGTVTQAVMSLPQKYREVVLLAYYQDVKLKDIAAMLGVPLPTVSTRLRRARLMLQE
ncbi:MAG: sigma-70 family RNA polymerase sigma factor, partial [Clostridia bacterium]|nr:sigma-70 family RNA polymerase sigma factor [Clostridia bacterium]